MKIYLDFDRTLFDTNTFLKEIYHIIEKYNISFFIFNKYKNKILDKGFNCYKIVENISKDYPIDQNIYKEFDLLIENDSIFIYSDVIEFLYFLKKNNYNIILLTKGNKEFQKKKIDYSGIKKYFDEIIITLNKKGNLKIDYDGVFIDDNVKELESINKKNPKEIICISRDNKSNTNFHTIKSLSEIYK